MTIKLMSWNVNGRTNKKVLGDQLRKIKNETADILALQEVKPKVLEHFKKELAESGLKYVETRSASQAYTSKARDSSLLIASCWEVKQIEIAKVPWEESVLSVVINSPRGEIEIHVIHVPNGRNNRREKIDTLNGIHEALSGKSKRHRILCGDFNSPQEEYSNGHVLTFDKKNEEFDGIKGRDCERRVICGLAKHDLADTYRKLNGYEKIQYSHFNKNKKTRRRADHIFSSHSLKPVDCDYLHPFRESDPAPSWRSDAVYDSERFLSDHAPVYAVYKPGGVLGGKKVS